MATYNLTAYGGTGLGYGKRVGFKFTADTSQSVKVKAQDDDEILNDWSTGNYNGTPTPGIVNGDTNSTVLESGISWLQPGEMITSGVWFEMEYTDPTTGTVETVDSFLLWDDTNNYWGGYSNSYVVTTKPLIDGAEYKVTAVHNSAGVPWKVLVCFARGTQLDTPKGEIAVENLRVGDLVTTADNGPQTIRWIGSQSVPAHGALAPIRLAQGCFGLKRDLLVSPNHRMLIESAAATLLFDEPEVLVPAKHLLSHPGITRSFGGSVEYFHILFDKHEVVFAAGARTESFQPGDHVMSSMAFETRGEILGLFPELSAGALFDGARMSLRQHEAACLVQAI